MKKILSVLFFTALLGVQPQAQDTLRTFTFASNDMTGITYGVSGALSATDMIGGEYTDAHAFSYNYFYWNRIADSAEMYNGNFGYNYPYIEYYMDYFKDQICAYLPGKNNGFMFASMIDYNYNHYSTDQNQRVNVYVGFPAVTIPSTTQVVEVAWTQVYAKYYDQCFVDYKVAGQWQTMEVNVMGVDVNINSWAATNVHYTLPQAAAQESSLELRLRYYSYGRGGAYGYCWAVDDFMVISGNPNQWKLGPEHFVGGFYDQLPQGMQIPTTWYTAAKNSGAITQTGVNVAFQHTSPTGTESTAFSNTFSDLAPSSTYDTLVVNPRGFYNAANPGWLNLGPNYGQSSISPIGNNGVPTTEAGLNMVKAVLSTDSLSIVYNRHYYSVTTADTEGVYAWGYGNGVLAGGTGGLCIGYSNSGYITDDPEESSYNQAGYRLLARLTTGNTLPMDSVGNPWVFRGMEMVVSPTATNIEGVSITPLLLRVEPQEEQQVSFFDVATGATDYTVTANDYTTLDTGYLMPGQYNTLRIMFPNQPVMEPNVSYLIGYQLNDYADFSLAVNRSYYYDGDNQAVKFDTVPGMEAYAYNTRPDSYDVGAFSTRGYIWSGSTVFPTPMLRALVGPEQEMPKTTVTVTAPTATVYSYANDNSLSGTGLVDTVVIGINATYQIYPTEGYEISDILIDGVSIFSEYSDYDENCYTEYVYDSLGNVTNAYERCGYTYTFYNISTPHSIVVTTTPRSQHSVTFNCPDHASVTGYLNDIGVDLNSVCGTHNYYSSSIQYNFYVESGYQIDSLVVDGVNVNLNGNYYTLYMGSANHTLSLYVTPFHCEVASFPYSMGFEDEYIYEQCWSKLCFHDTSYYNTATGDLINIGNWNRVNYNYYSHSGDYCLYSMSSLYTYDEDYNYTFTPFDVDNWIISPSIQIPSGTGAYLKWYTNIDVYDTYDYFGLTPSETYSVYVSTTGTDTANFTRLGEYTHTSYGWQEMNLDLTAYAGQTIHIAFRHTGGTLELFLDDINVETGHMVSVNCTGRGSGYTVYTDNPTRDLCGTSEILPQGFIASYDFIPTDGHLDHLYVNNVDRINDVVTHSSGSSISSYTYSFTVTGNTTINPVFNYDFYPVTINCSGDGLGYVRHYEYNYNENLCGEVDSVRQGFLASYAFIPSRGNELTHLYVNNVDHINDANAHTNGTYNTISYTYDFNVNAASTVMPVFSRIPYTITATSANPSMGMVTGGGNYFYDSIATLTATPMPHYEFLYWGIIWDGDTNIIDNEELEEEGFNINPLQFPVQRDMSLVAFFGPESYTVTVAPNNVLFGSVEGGGTFEYLQPVTVSANAYSGYHFQMWSNGSTYNPYTFPASENLDLVAIFIADGDSTQYFAVTTAVNDPTMGSVTGSGVFTLGQTTTLTAVPNSGYHFVQWQDGNTDNPRTITVTANVEYTAYFAADQGITYTLTVLSSNDTMGTVTGSGSFAYGDEAELKAMPLEGFRFVQWQDGDTANPRIVIVTSDSTFTATFAPLTGIGDVAENNATVYSYENRIFVSGTEGRSVRVFDISGRLLTRVDRAAERLVFTMQHTGVYIVTIGEKAYRVVIR